MRRVLGNYFYTRILVEKFMHRKVWDSFVIPNIMTGSRNIALLLLISGRLSINHIKTVQNISGLIRSSRGACEEFSEGTCPITDFTVIEVVHTAAAHDCQNKCQLREECHYFTWFSTQCYLLRRCDYIDTCQCCVSGPGEVDTEDVENCMPCQDPVTLSSSTSTTVTPSTTTRSTTTPKVTSTTTVKTSTTTLTTSTTTATTTTTTSGQYPGPEPQPCDETSDDGWFKVHPHSNHCFKIISGYSHIAECNAECINSLGSMASVHTDEENNFIVNLMSRWDMTMK